MYMPGRLRTGSRPSRTVMSLAVYEFGIGSGLPSAGRHFERRRSRRRLEHAAQERAALHDFAPLAAARRLLVLGRGNLLFAAERRLDHQRVFVVLGDLERDNDVAVLELEQEHALARPRQVAHFAE